MLVFPEENLRSIRIITTTIPIAIACYSKRDEELVIGFESTIEENGYDYLEVVTWCRDNGLLCSSYCEIKGVSVSFKLQ